MIPLSRLPHILLVSGGYFVRDWFKSSPELSFLYNKLYFNIVKKLVLSSPSHKYIT